MGWEFAKLRPLFACGLLGLSLSGGIFAAGEDEVPPEAPGNCAYIVAEDPTGNLPREQKDWIRDVAATFRSGLVLPSLADATVGLGEIVPAEPASDKLLFYVLNRYRAHDVAIAKRRLINLFTKACRMSGRMVSLEDLAETMNLDTEGVNRLFGEDRLFADRDALKNAAMAEKENSFKFVIDTDILESPERKQALLDAINNRSRLLVTTAVAGARVDLDLLNSLLSYAEKEDAEIIIYPSNMQTTGLDPILFNTPRVHILTHSIELGPTLQLNAIKIMAKQRNPLMGLDFIGKRGQSQIVGHPQMHLRTIATGGNAQSPHRIMSTGAITVPNYAGDKYVSWRTDALAAADHVMGGLMLERDTGFNRLTGLPQNGGYHVRRLEYIPEKKGFSDIDKFYSGNRVAKSRPEVLVLGDIHVRHLDQRLIEPLRRQIFALKPKYIVLHDVFDGNSLNPHEKDKSLTLAKAAQRGGLDVDKELRDAVTFINSLLAMDRSLKIIMVPSNHDYFFTRWLENQSTVNDAGNRKVFLQASMAALDGKDPLEQMLLDRGVAYPKRFLFIPRGGGYKVGPIDRFVEVGTHGHAGGNGGKGTLKTLRKAFERIVYGHTHTLAWENGAVTTGTSTELVLPYTKDGVSSWVQALALVSEDGGIQVLQFQNGNWYLDRNAERPPAEGFFPAGYPKVLPNNDEDRGGIGQVDQYR